MNHHIGGKYLRMETDAEYRTRLYAAKRSPGPALGRELDAFGDGHNIQRRIVEDQS